MKRFLAILATGALAATLASSAYAQVTRPIGAGALVLDDNNGKTITIITPHPGDPGYAQWTGNLTWKIPIPPTPNAQAGWVYPGNSVDNGLELLYWDYPSTTTVTQPGSTNTGGPQGSWKPSTTAALNIVTNSTPGIINTIPKWDAAHDLTNSSISDNGTVVSTTEALDVATIQHAGNIAVNPGLGNTITTNGGLNAQGLITTAGNITTTGTGSITAANGLTVTANGANITGNTTINTVGAGTTAIGNGTNSLTLAGNTVINGGASTGTTSINNGTDAAAVAIGNPATSNLALTATTLNANATTANINGTTTNVNAGTNNTTNINSGASTGTVNIANGSGASNVNIGNPATTTTIKGTTGITGVTTQTGVFHLAGDTSPLRLNGLDGTTNQLVQSAGPGNTPTYTSDVNLNSGTFNTVKTDALSSKTLGGVITLGSGITGAGAGQNINNVNIGPGTAGTGAFTTLSSTSTTNLATASGNTGIGNAAGSVTITGVANSITGSTSNTIAGGTNTITGTTNTITGSTANNVNGPTNVTGATTIVGNTLINGGTSAGTTSINNGTGTGAVAIGNANTTTLGLTATTINAQGTTNINVSGSNTTTIGNAAAGTTAINGATNVTGTTNINTGGTAATSIGNNGGNTTITTGGVGNLALVGIAAGLPADDMLTINAGNQVRRRVLTGTADQGVQYNVASGTYQLGTASAAPGAATAVPFLANRQVNLDGSNLAFTSNGGALTPVQIVGGATPQFNVTAPTTITGPATVNGATTIHGTTLINNAAGDNANNTTIGSATNSGTFAANGGSVNLNTLGTGNTAIGNATGTTSITGTTNTITGTTSNTVTGPTNVNTTGGNTTTIGNVTAGTTAVNGTTNINTGTSNGTTSIGNTTNGSNVTIGVSGANNLVLNGIASDLLPTTMLTLNGANVRQTPLSGTALEGIQYSNGAYRLGASTNLANPLTSTRNVNLASQTLNFTQGAAGATLASLNGSSGAINLNGNAGNTGSTTIGNQTGTVGVTGLTTVTNDVSGKPDNTYAGLNSTITSGTSGVLSLVGVRGTATGTDDRAVGVQGIASGPGFDIGGDFTSLGANGIGGNFTGATAIQANGPVQLAGANSPLRLGASDGTLNQLVQSAGAGLTPTYTSNVILTSGTFTDVSTTNLHGNANGTAINLKDDLTGSGATRNINNVNIGATTPGTGAFTTLTSSGASTIGTGPGLTNTFGTGTGALNTIGETSGTNTINGTTNFGTNSVTGSNFTVTGTNGSTINGTPIGATTPSTGAFTTLTSSGNSTLGTSATATTNSFGTGGNAVAVSNTIGSSANGSTTLVNGLFGNTTTPIVFAPTSDGENGTSLLWTTSQPGFAVALSNTNTGTQGDVLGILTASTSASAIPLAVQGGGLVGNILAAHANGDVSISPNVGSVTMGNATANNTLTGTNNTIATGDGNLTLTGIATDAAPTTMLTLNGANNVRQTPLSGTAQEGIVFTNGAYRLGSATGDPANAFTANRTVSLGGNQMNYTGTGSAGTFATLNGSNGNVGFNNNTANTGSTTIGNPTNGGPLSFGAATMPAGTAFTFQSGTAGTASNTNLIKFGDGAGFAYLTAGSNYAAFSSGDGNARVAIANGGANIGDVGINTVTPTHNLEVNGTFAVNGQSTLAATNITGAHNVTGVTTQTGALNLAGNNSPLQVGGNGGTINQVLTSTGNTTTPTYSSSVNLTTGTFTTVNTDNLNSKTAGGVITLGSGITGAGAGQNLNNVNVGATTAGTGAFTTLTSSGASTIGTGANLTNTFGTGTAALNTIGNATGTNTVNGTTNFAANSVTGSNFTVTGGTINGTSIGATTASTGSFTTLNSSGSTTLGTTGVTVNTLGNTNAGTSNTISGTNNTIATGTGNLSLTGIAADNTTTSLLTLDGTNNVRTHALSSLITGSNGVDVTYTGGVADAHFAGTSTAAPFTSTRYINTGANQLNVTGTGVGGTSFATLNGANGNIGFNNNTANTGSTTIGNPVAGGPLSFGAATQPGATSAFTFQSGTAGFASNTNLIKFGDGAGFAYLTAGNTYAALSTGDGTARIVVQNASAGPNFGDVGINTTTPSHNLEVNGTFAVNGQSTLAATNVTGPLGLVGGSSPLRLNNQDGTANQVLQSAGAGLTPTYTSDVTLTSGHFTDVYTTNLHGNAAGTAINLKDNVLGNGSQNIDGVNIGATTPGTGSFTTLNSTGNTTLASTSGSTFTAGNTGAATVINGSTNTINGGTTINGVTNVAGNILPTADRTYNLGSATKRFINVYATPASFHVVEIASDYGGGATPIDYGIGADKLGNFQILANGGAASLSMTPAGALTTAAGITATTGNITSTAGGFVTGATTRIANNGDATLGAITAASLNAGTGLITTLGAVNGATVTTTGLVTAGNGLTVTAGSITTPLAAGVLHSAGAGTGLTASAINLASTDVTGTLPIANGGTNSTATPTPGGIAYGTGTAYAFTVAGSAGNFLTSNGAGVPTWTAGVLAGDVAGALNATQIQTAAGNRIVAAINAATTTTDLTNSSINGTFKSLTANQSNNNANAITISGPIGGTGLDVSGHGWSVDHGGIVNATGVAVGVGTISGTTLTLLGKATSASTVSGDGATTLVTKDFVTTAGNTAVLTNSSLTGNGTTGSALGINLSNPNTFTATQTLPNTNAQGNNLITAVNAGTAGTLNGSVVNPNFVAQNIVTTGSITGGSTGQFVVSTAGAITAASLNAGIGTIQTTGAFTGGTGSFTTANTTPAVTATGTGAGATSTGVSASVTGAATTNNALTVSATNGGTNNAINVTGGNVRLAGGSYPAGAGAGNATAVAASTVSMTTFAGVINLDVANSTVTVNLPGVKSGSAVIVSYTDPTSGGMVPMYVTNVAPDTFRVQLAASPKAGSSMHYMVINP